MARQGGFSWWRWLRRRLQRRNTAPPVVLGEGDARFIRFMEHLPGLAWIKDGDGRYVYANSAAERAFGVPRERLYGRTDADVFPPDTARQFRDNDLRALANEAGIQTLETLEHADGALRHSLVAKFPIPAPDGRGVLVGGMAIDITERKLAEEALRIRARQQQTVARLGEVALRADDLQALLQFATAMVAETLEVDYCKVLELLPGGQALLLRAGVGWRDGLVGCATLGVGRDSQAGFTLLSDAPVIVEDLAAETRFSGPPLLHEHRVVSGLSCVIRAPDGTAWGVLGAHAARCVAFTPDDASFLVAVASTLGAAAHRMRAEQALREADRRKDEFLATLAHELRNPLAPLRNGLQVMKLAGTDADAAAPIRAMMERQLAQMVRLIDDLLDVSRISRGMVELRLAPIELAVVVQSALETVRPLVEQAGHALVLRLPPDTLCVQGDAVRLAQVFSNLVSNAGKFCDRNGHIWLTVERQGGEAVVSVRDDGVGIPADMLDRVFEMFTQVDGSPERSQGGLGIGLALVRALVALHGGSVEARSEGPGTGSEFVVRLPAVPAEIDARTPGDADAPRLVAARRILVVDDNRDAAISLATLLRILGNDARSAFDGSDALELAAEFRPEVVFLDIGMPRLNGYDVARRMREQPWGRRVVLIAVTGWGQDDDRRRTHAAGFDFHLVKPVEPAALEELLAGLAAARDADPGAQP